MFIFEKKSVYNQKLYVKKHILFCMLGNFAICSRLDLPWIFFIAN